MKIIVCAKQIRHTYARTGKSPESKYIEPEDGVYRINPYDEAALELALKLKDENENVRVILLALGSMIAESEIRRCLAAGADDLYRIDAGGQAVSSGGTANEDPLDQADPWVKSGLMALAVKKLGGDLVLCGKTSIDRGNGQVGAFLAHRLDLPFVSAITDLSLDESGSLFQVQRSAGRGVREIIECSRPALFSVDLGPELRLPKFAGRQWAGKYVPKELDFADEIDTPKIVSTRRFQPRPRPKIVPPPDSRLHAYERVMQLLAGSKVEKSGEILTGNPESQVDGIFDFLKTNGFLESGNDDR